MSPHAASVSTRLRLGALRAGFMLGGRLVPKRTADRAAQLFATPFASSRSRALATPDDVTMQRGELQIGNERIATYVWGDPARQPYALLAHGWSSFGLRFQPWVDGLRALGYAVVTFDQPGHGRSSGRLCTLPEFTATIRAVGRHYGEAALAVGHSLGGAALVLAQDEDWHAQRLVLVAPAADMADAASRYFRLVRLGEHLRQAFYDWLLRRTGISVEQLEVYRRLPALGQPALIVHDLGDTDVPWSEGERYARYWPGARLLSTEGLGHRRVLDAPDTINAALAFVRGEAVGERVVGTSELPFGVA